MRAKPKGRSAGKRRVWVSLQALEHCRARRLGLRLLAFAACAAGVAHGQMFQELHSFAPFGDDGYVPQGALLETSDGSFYGTTFYGGAWDWGSIFRITSEGVLTTLASLDATNTDQHPISGLTRGRDGNFYFTTVAPSRILSMTPGGVLALYGEGMGTEYDLVMGSDGYLYAVDSGDYQGIFGYVYRFRPDTREGNLLFQFDYSHPLDGYYPSGGLVQAKDGNFYGVTGMGGGLGGRGVVYRVRTNGTYTVMCTFRDGPGNARYPHGRLLQSSDGSFYGVADGGRWGDGAIFKMTPDGQLSTVASLDGYYGARPNGGLVEANDGNFYGTAFGGGGIPAKGTVFRVSPNGELSLVVAFTGTLGPYPGATPYAGLIRGSDGNLYGTCGTEGTRGSGNIFRISMPGPELSIRKTASQAVLSWRTNYVGFSLQSSPDLSAGSWTAVTNPPAIGEGKFWITNGLSWDPLFFRLKK